MNSAQVARTGVGIAIVAPARIVDRFLDVNDDQRL
jgi:hypothetical protein